MNTNERYNGYNRSGKENPTKSVMATFWVGDSTVTTDVTADGTDRVLTVFASDVFGALNGTKSWETVPVYGYWPVSFTMTTAKGTWTFSEFQMPEFWDGQAVTYVTKVAHPDGSETVWTMVVFND